MAQSPSATLEPARPVAPLAGRGPLAKRRAQGKAERTHCPRTEHAQFVPAPGRDALALLAASNQGRVPALLPIRHGRMAVSPFAFFRGAAALMAHDLAQGPRTGLPVQLCGDCHLMNFGLFASPERALLFGINDFDETLPGPFEWDLKRLAASFVVAARDRKFPDAVAIEAVRMLAATWRTRLMEFAAMDPLALWYYKIADSDLMALATSRDSLRKRRAVVKRARGRAAAALAGQTMVNVDGQWRIKENPPLICRLPGGPDADRFEADVRQLLGAYRNSLADDRRALLDEYRLCDVAIKIAGVGSVGTRCGIALLVADNEAPLFLQFKEARHSVLEPYAGGSVYEQRGHRVVSGQRMIQPATDIFLGWARSANLATDFYVRQLRDMKGAVRLERMEPQDLIDYAHACGWALARAQAKAGDPALLSGYVGRSDVFDRALETFALTYAAQNEADWRALTDAIAAGKIEAVTE